MENDLGDRSELVWTRPIGTIEDQDFLGLHTGLIVLSGMPSRGGGVITGGDVAFF